MDKSTVNVVKKGSFKKELGTIKVNDFMVGNIIINALVENGFDVVAKTIRNQFDYQIGEEIKIYKTDVI